LEAIIFFNYPPPENIVLAYVQSKEKDTLYVTLALYSKDGIWIDMMRDKDLKTKIDVVCWIDIPQPPDPYRFATSLKMHHYRTIYHNNVLDMKE